MNKLKSKFEDVPKNDIKFYVIGLISIFIGIFLMTQIFNINTKNSNEFKVPTNAYNGQYTICTIGSDNLAGLNYKALTTNKLTFAKGQQTMTFILSNAQSKLEQFKDQNKRRIILTMSEGKPRFVFTLYSVTATPWMQGTTKITLKDGTALYKGYSNVKDAEAGTNKKTYLVKGDVVQVLNNDNYVDTNVGKLKISPE